MSWSAYGVEGFGYPFWRRRSRVRQARRVLRGIARGSRSMLRNARPHRQRRGCCCPLFLLLGLAGLGLAAGLFYAGIRILGWA
jgi:hypothetical protein